jgi:type I restriction enzyme, S subunit
MSRDLKYYLEYKDSGVPCQGDVPWHWEVVSGRSSFVGKHGPNSGLAEITVLSLSYGQISLKSEECGDLLDGESAMEDEEPQEILAEGG